jgi:uncharacterized protein (DUF433 family)
LALFGLAGKGCAMTDLIVTDPEIMSGTPCFRGTRVPVSVLFDNLADGMTIDEIIQEWPSLNKDDVIAFLGWTSDEISRIAAA